MPTSTLTSKGQITVPKPIREYLHVAEGDQVDFAITPNGEVVMHRLIGSVDALAGIFHQPTRKAVSLEDMDSAITGAVMDRARKRR